MAGVNPHNDVISAPINAVGLIESVLDDQKAGTELRELEESGPLVATALHSSSELLQD